MKKLYTVFVVLSGLFYATNIFAQAASVTWALNNTTQLTSASVGNVTGSAESINSGSGQFGMSVFDYSNDGQRLWENTAGWIAGAEEATRYIQFDALFTIGNSFTVTNVSFNYGAAGINGHIQSNVYYSTDGWQTRTLLNSGPLAYPNPAMLQFTQSVNVAVVGGTTFSLRIYPYAILNSIAMSPTFAVHNNIVITGATATKKNCVIQLTNVVGKWGKSVLLTAKLQEIGAAGNTNLPNQVLKFYMDSVYVKSGTTNASGVASLIYTIPQDSATHSISAPQDSVAHSISATYVGDANYNAQSGTGTLTIVRHVTGVVVTPTIAIYGQPVVLVATLVDNDNDGKGVSNQELKFYKISPGTREGNTTRVYVGSGITNSDGTTNVVLELQGSELEFVASFAGDANYSPKSGTGTLKKMTAIQITDTAGKWGKTILLTARLQKTGLTGNTNLPNQEIKFYMDSVYVKSGTTNASGVASVMYTIPQDSVTHSISAPQDSVAHSISATYVGDANYNAQSGTGKLTVVRHVTTLSIRGHDGGAGKIYTQDLALTDNDNSGNGIPNQILKFYIDKVYVKSGTTNASGVASISFTLPQDSVSHSITASYAGDVNYSPQSNTGTITYTLKSCIIQMTNVASKWGKSVLLTAKLHETGLTGNTNLPNQRLKFYQDSVYINSATTNSSGIASLMYTIPQDSATHSITAPQDSVAHSMRVEFAGDVNYSAQNGVGTLTVVRHTTSISVANKSGSVGQTITLEATLTDNDENGKGVSGQALKFYKISYGTREGDTAKVYAGSGITNSSGLAIQSSRWDDTDIVHVEEVIFEGDANYRTQSGTGKFTITVVGVENNQADISTKFDLSQNYPNPFNPTTTIKYDIPKTGFVTISVYDILGREIKILVNEEKNPGHYEIIFNARELSSGIYFYTIRTSDFSLSKKMILMK
ncbi:MAG: T9SS type A sorting domain-containing protein [Ignavibacteriales bacterium]|nr:T9SS type A sorting domain-containing protein [Ignavibacteriales bacterium]